MDAGQRIWVRTLYHIGVRGLHLPAASLPSQFDTPMFWSEEELAELKGTSVVGTFVQFSMFDRVRG